MTDATPQGTAPARAIGEEHSVKQTDLVRIALVGLAVAATWKAIFRKAAAHGIAPRVPADSSTGRAWASWRQMAGASSGVESDVADPPPGQSDVHQRQKGAHPADGETIRQTQIQETHGESRKKAEGRFE